MSEIHDGRLNAKGVFMPKKMVKLSNSWSKMEQSSCLEETRFAEEPPEYGIKSSTTIFKENRTDLEASRFLVDRRELHSSSSRRTWSSAQCAEERNIPNTAAIH